MSRMLSTVVALLGVLLLMTSALAQVPEIVWEFTLPETFNSSPADVAVAQNGDLVAGMNYRSGPQNGFLEQQAVARMTGAGALQWIVYPTFGVQKKNFIHDIAVDPSGNSWVVGREGNPSGWDSPYVLKLANNGNELWRQVYPPVTNASIHRVLPQDDGTAILLGTSLNENENKDGVAAKLSAAGNMMWMREYGGFNDDILVNGIPFDDGFLFAGGRNQVGQYYNLYFVHTTATGGIIWESQLNTDLFILHGLEPLPNGGFATLVSALDVLWVQWFLPDGSLLGELQLDIFLADPKFDSSPFQVMSDGGFLIGGRNDSGDAVLLRTDSQGATVWEAVYPHYDPSGTQAISAVTLLPNGRIQFAGAKNFEVESAWLVQLAAEGEPEPSSTRVLEPFMDGNTVFGVQAEASDPLTVQPSEFSLSPAYPNPFNATTTLTVNLPESAELNVAVFNVAGQRVAELANGMYSAGTQRLEFDASGLTSGVYFVRAFVPGHLDQVQKVMLVR